MKRHNTKTIIITGVSAVFITALVVAQTHQPPVPPRNPSTVSPSERIDSLPKPVATPAPVTKPIAPDVPASARFARTTSEYATAATVNFADDTTPARRASLKDGMRAFILQQWQAKQKGRIAHLSTLKHGYAPGTTTFYVEPDEAGKWRISIEVQGAETPRHFYFVEQVPVDERGRRVRDESEASGKYALLLKPSAKTGYGILF